MEAFGAAFNVNGLYQNFQCYTKKLVSNGDASTKSVLGWSCRQAQEFFKAVWPRTEANSKKKDNRLLHILHKRIEFLADANHRVKTYAGPLFALGRLPEGVSEATSTDAERMKRNMGYAIHQNKKKDLDGMRKAMTAILEHHFNDHTFCGEWCRALFWKDDERVRQALKYRCKEKNSKLYEQLKIHHDKFVTDEWIRDLMHDYDTNKPESFNGFLTEFARLPVSYRKSTFGEYHRAFHQVVRGPFPTTSSPSLLR
jgi:hypothetical protein